MSNPLIFSGATSNRKSVCIALFLNKFFTALHRSTSVCILGTISECKDKSYF